MSRYSDYDGYWLFGFLVGTVEPREIDLLASQTGTGSPHEKAAFLAQAKFADQLAKARIAKSQIRSARLWIVRSPDPVRRHDYNVLSRELERVGYRVACRSEVTLFDESVYVVEREIFVAPHDPSLESRSCSG